VLPLLKRRRGVEEVFYFKKNVDEQLCQKNRKNRKSKKTRKK